MEISLEGNVTLNALFRLIDRQLQDSAIRIHGGRQAALYELKLFSAMYVNAKDQVEDVLCQIEKAAIKRDMKAFETWRGAFDPWLQKLKDEINQRDEFMTIIQSNRQDNKLSKLKFSELIR